MTIRTTDEGRWHHRELLVDDEVVSELSVIDYEIRIGTAHVRMAGIGGVHTDGAHRMKGYARRLLEDTVRYMTDGGYDVSMLFGIAKFYPKFGYAMCLPSYKFTIQTRDAEDAGQLIQHPDRCRTRPSRTRSSKDADAQALSAIYEQNNQGRVCSVVRSPAYFEQLIQKNLGHGTWWNVSVEARLWEDAEGQPMAYAAWDKSDEAVNVVEVASRDDSLFPTLLYAFVQDAIEKRCGKIALYMPLDHPFAEFAQRYGGKWEIKCPRDGGGMMRVLNQDTLFEKLAPELTRRLRASELAQFTGSLAIQTDLGVTAIQIQQGVLTVSTSQDNAAEPGLSADLTVSLSQDKLMQLLAGYRPARDVLNDPDVQAQGDILPVLDALFPKAIPYVWLPDHF
jgi:predicted acetyltransferase